MVIQAKKEVVIILPDFGRNLDSNGFLRFYVSTAQKILYVPWQFWSNFWTPLPRHFQHVAARFYVDGWMDRRPTRSSKKQLKNLKKKLQKIGCLRVDSGAGPQNNG